MKKMTLASLFIAQNVLAFAAFADPAALTVKLDGIADGQPIPEKYAFCTADVTTHTKDGGNISPGISWSGAPDTTKSYAIIVVDRDVPASFDNANQEGKTVAADFPRQNFYHWALADIPGTVTSLAEGADSKGMVKTGKPGGKMDFGLDGINDYAKFNMGQGGGYDGPCPPWNDERMHHYHFIVYALDVATTGLSGKFSGPELEKAMEGHIVGKGETVGTYTQNLSASVSK